MRASKQSDSPVGYCRDVYAERNATKRLRVLSRHEQRIRDREIAAERARITWGVGTEEDPTGFAPGAWI